MTNETIFEIRKTNAFEKSLKKAVKKGLDVNEIKKLDNSYEFI